jgi:2-phosphosulfolactate phosphatase
MPEHRLNVFYLPQEVDERELTGSSVIVIDVLRATSTICQALAAGAREVVPFVEIDEAIAAANKLGRKNVVLGGERKGVLIDGFDLGNSPSEYTASAIQGRPVFITTTNGTRALQHARLAKQVIAASFLNLSAIVASLKNEAQVDILCAGTDGSETTEDILLAGAIVHKLMSDESGSWVANEQAEVAAGEWKKVILAADKNDESLHRLVSNSLNASLGGQNLISVGNSADIPVCARVDSLSIVPRLSMRDWKITASKPV